MKRVRTDLLEIAYDEGGPAHGPVVLLLHGWPDDPRGWRACAARLQDAGYRTIAPYLRGFGPTRFLSEDTLRDGRAVALTHDAIDLVDALGLERFAVAGHDWGARIGYTLAALAPQRITKLAALSTAFAPRGVFSVPRFSQVRRYWYQWFMTLEIGGHAVREDPKGWARAQWETWAPRGWFDDDEFERTAKSFENPDWPAITLSSYRGRWREEPSDPRYDDAARRLGEIETLATPTLVIHGGADTCTEPAATEGMEPLFRATYRRIVLDGVGHFPAREAPEAVAEAILAHLRE